MPTHRFHPALSTLPRRIAPSGLPAVPAIVATVTPVTTDAPVTPHATPHAMPGSTAPIGPGTWTQPVDGTNPTMDPNKWVVLERR